MKFNNWNLSTTITDSSAETKSTYKASEEVCASLGMQHEGNRCMTWETLPEEVLDSLGNHMGWVLALPCDQQAAEHTHRPTVADLA